MTNSFSLIILQLNCFGFGPPPQYDLIDYYPILVLALMALALIMLTNYIKIYPLNRDLGVPIYSQPDIIDQYSNTVDADIIPMKGTQSKLGKWCIIILVVLMLLAPTLIDYREFFLTYHFWVFNM